MGIQSLDRFSVFAGVAVLTLVSLLLVVLSPWAWLGVAVFGALPLVALFLALQRSFVRGIVLTGLREG